jgi:hypothetical protein
MLLQQQQLMMMIFCGMQSLTQPSGLFLSKLMDFF